MFDRRHFLTATAGVMAAVAVNPLATAARINTGSGSVAPLPSLDQALSKDVFTALQGELFRIRSDTGAVVEARLIVVRDEGCCRELEQFSVVFHATPGTQVGEASYALEHRTAGRCRLYLHPGETDTHGQSLTAVFSLLRQA